MAILFVDLGPENFLATPFVFIHQPSRLLLNIDHNFDGKAFLIKCFMEDKRQPARALCIIHEKPLVVIAPDSIKRIKVHTANKFETSIVYVWDPI
eukprot:jgi/Psemu1/33946/gm1.33946_g